MCFVIVVRVEPTYSTGLSLVVTVSSTVFVCCGDSFSERCGRRPDLHVSRSTLTCRPLRFSARSHVFHVILFVLTRSAIWTKVVDVWDLPPPTRHLSAVKSSLTSSMRSLSCPTVESKDGADVAFGSDGGKPEALAVSCFRGSFLVDVN